MKGIIFNLVEDAVVARYGEAAWDAVLDDAGLDGVYTSLGNYPDTDLVALVGAGSRLLEVPAPDLTRAIGESAARGLAEQYPGFFEPHASVRPFLLTLNEVIHTEVRKLHADSSPPDFWFDGDDPDTLVIHYRSGRRLCHLAEGMITGAAAHYGQSARLEQTTCMLEGADHCTIHASFRVH